MRTMTNCCGISSNINHVAVIVVEVVIVIVVIVP
jgi:hypothetical protein